MTILAHKIRLYPNDKQKTMLAKSCGASRFAYNWALAEWKRQYDSGEKPNETKLRRELNAIKKEQFPWMYEVCSSSKNFCTAMCELKRSNIIITLPL